MHHLLSCGPCLLLVRSSSDFSGELGGEANKSGIHQMAKHIHVCIYSFIYIYMYICMVPPPCAYIFLFWLLNSSVFLVQQTILEGLAEI